MAAEAESASGGGSDEEAIARVVREVYAILSGPAGCDRRDWARFRALHVPGARSAPFRVDADGRVSVDLLDVDGYIESRRRYFDENDFWEVEVDRVVDVRGRLAHVMSTYESRRAPDGPPFTRGVNSIQLVKDGAEWKVLSTTWRTQLPAPGG